MNEVVAKACLRDHPAGRVIDLMRFDTGSRCGKCGLHCRIDNGVNPVVIGWRLAQHGHAGDVA